MSADTMSQICDIYREGIRKQLAEQSIFFKDLGPPIYGPFPRRCYAEWNGCDGPSCDLVEWHEGPHSTTDYDGRSIWWDR